MKKLLMLILICQLNCFGQIETKEDFINQIFPTVYAAHKFYYLFDKAMSISFKDTNELYLLRNVLNEKIDSNTINELYKNAKRDNTDTFWNFSKLSIARPFNNDSIKITTLFKHIVIVKREWNESRIARQERKQLKRQESKIKKAGGSLFYFSSPVFDDLRQYALISLSHYCGSLCGGGCLYLFKKINGKWEKIGETHCWIS
jgi:hypothetical protein